jgi:NACHT domain
VLINPGDVADGILVNALWAVGQMVARPGASRRAAAELDLAGWMDIEKLTGDGLPGAKLELPDSLADTPAFESAVKRDEVQGALQALLATRLTDAPEADAARAREGVRLALGDARFAGPVSDYFDRKICDLVGRLEGSVGLPGLSQVRAEAYNSRIVALLGAIERQITALGDAGSGGQEEADFLRRYRQQARYRHGSLEPPDFERRRRVPVRKIYVNTSVYEHPVRTVLAQAAPVRLNVVDLARRLDRTVLLGNPGGGKTTAANVLANLFASDDALKVPFLVTLRDYAATYPPERSVVRHIEYTLETMYQCAAPDGLVERLLLTGRAVVIFDGLDELLDTSRRRDVSERVEQFCSAYPLTPVLVTSRLVGYDQARLDEEQFTCYKLGGFRDDEVAEYARKWFALQEDMVPAVARAEAEGFLAESVSASDLRSNPLLLSLMCILYRGAGSLPRERAGIYARCAELLFGKWDEQRRIHRELRVGDFVEPAIRHLAWWLFSSGNSRARVTERELVKEATKFLHGRAFESRDEADAAATEFVQFCRGRMWVLSDAGTTADGEKIYGFTHRTFLEYFAAAHLAAISDTPEDLARILRPHVTAGEWEVVSQLAIQLKNRSSDRGADRIYADLLESVVVPEARGCLLVFLAESLKYTRISPATVRKLTRAMMDRDRYRYRSDGWDVGKFSALVLLITSGAHHEQVIADEMSSRIGAMVISDDAVTRAEGLQLALEAAWVAPNDFWRVWSREQARQHTAVIAAEAAASASLRTVALYAAVISIGQALTMPGGFGALMGGARPMLAELRATVPFPLFLCSRLLGAVPDPDAIADFTAIGRYLTGHPTTPWVHIVRQDYARPVWDPAGAATGRSGLDELCALGIAAVICVDAELSQSRIGAGIPPGKFQLGDLGPLLDFYVTGRLMRSFGLLFELPDLPLPEEFRQVFKDWGEGRVNFVGFLGE